MSYMEEQITDFFTVLCQWLFFFCKDTQQSFLVTVIHYAVFIGGFIYFFFFSAPRDIFRILFFVFIVIATLSYYCFNRCIVGVVEYKLSHEKNSIQSFMDRCFGENEYGNIYSKGALTFFTVMLSIILLHDYDVIRYTYYTEAHPRSPSF